MLGVLSVFNIPFDNTILLINCNNSAGLSIYNIVSYFLKFHRQ